MPLTNYRDLSVGGSDIGAGFQYEFFCSNCERTWKSPFKPYRMGQITGLFSRFSFLFDSLRTAGRTTGSLADLGSRSAKESAFNETCKRAETLFSTCPGCRRDMCGDCYDPSQGACVACLAAKQENTQHTAEAQANRAASSCPSCGQPHAGGRFCAECGFDMASTHKSCPACNALLPRQARFCTDCGHGF
jgi:ribosomal protein L32